jgi:hypothetical protein
VERRVALRRRLNYLDNSLRAKALQNFNDEYYKPLILGTQGSGYHDLGNQRRKDLFDTVVATTPKLL